MNIAVWNTAFLGDAILTLPLLQTLRMHYPQASIDFYVRKGFSGLFKSGPAVNNVYEYDKRGKQKSFGASIAFGRELREKHYDIWISAHQSLRSAFIAAQSRAKMRIGYDTPKFNRIFYTNTVARRFSELHEVDRLLQLVNPLGISELSEWPEIVLSPDVREKTAAFFAPLKNRPVLGLHPGSVWATKRWPAGYFAEVARMALAKGARVVLFAGPGEEETAAEVLAGASAGYALGQGSDADIIDLSGKLSIPELAAYIAGLGCYISNDSGPMHLAWAQHVPLVAIFGPTVQSLGFAPRGENSTLLEVQNLECRPCGLHGPQVCPKGHHRCMRDLTAETIWAEVEKKLFAM